MKPFWQDMFYDLENLSGDEVADCWGKNINRDLDQIETAIREYDLIKALALINDCKEYY